MRGRAWVLAALFASAASGAAVAAGSGNPMTDRLLAQPENRRIQILSAGIKGCVGTRAFLMGVTQSGRYKGTAYWSLACADGRNLAIQISADKKGTSFVGDCSMLQGTGRECFQKF